MSKTVRPKMPVQTASQSMLANLSQLCEFGRQRNRASTDVITPSVLDIIVLTIFSFGHELVKAVVDRIVEKGNDYCSTINTSAAIARQGCWSVDRIVGFCDQLLRADGSQLVLKCGLQDSIQLAKRVHQNSLNMNMQFRSMRNAFMKARLLRTPHGCVHLTTSRSLDRN